MDFNCPLDGAPLLFHYNEENDAYVCPLCNVIYPTLNKKEADVLKDIESTSLSYLYKYNNRLKDIELEKQKITKIFKFVEESGLLKKLNKANLSSQKKEVWGHTRAIINSGSLDD